MLQRPFFTPVVVGFWCATMAWLFVAKILPDWQPGAPPGQQAFYASGSRLIPVAWTVICDERPIGWALTRLTPTADAGVFVESHLHFDDLPLSEMLPDWASLLVRRTGATVDATFDARGRLMIDEQGVVRSFLSVVTIPGTSRPVILTGVVEDGALTIQVSAGEMRYEVSRHLPTGMMIGDELSPQATLPGLFTGRRWTVPIYSPIRVGGSPLEILHAEVGGEETIPWEDRLIPTHVVSYRDDPASDREPRCRLWVDRSGRVLRQEARLLGTRIAFVRRSDAEAARMAATDGSGAASASLPAAAPEPPAR